MQYSRREVLAALAAAGVFTPIAHSATQNTPISRLAEDAGIKFGSAFDREIFSDTSYQTLIASQCRIGAIENAMKLDWLRPKGPSADFSIADKLVDFATSNQIALRGTALIWNDWEPPWVKALSVREIAALMDRHIDETVAKYSGRMWAWDVVNEPFFPMHGRAGGYRKGVWFESMGPAYVARAFRRAAAADPAAHLILNEAFCEQNDDLGISIRPRFFNLVRELKDAGVKIDGVGFQGHLKPHLPYDYGAFATYLRSFAKLGVDLHITELDVDDSSFPDDPQRRDDAVADVLQRFLRPVLDLPRLKSITLWHLSDRYSWYRPTDFYGQQVAKFGGNARRTPRSHFLDDALKPKRAWQVMADEFRAHQVR